MEQNDDMLKLLKEIRDLQRQQLSIMRAQQTFSEKDKKSARIMTIVKMGYTICIVVFVIVAFYMFYSTIGTMIDSF